jgi:hypothetical protein
MGDENFMTVVTRSPDLITWQDSPMVVLSAYGYSDEGKNNSDMDLVEYQGQTIISYATGDQKTWDHLKFAKYNGTMESFVKEFFKY